MRTAGAAAKKKPRYPEWVGGLTLKKFTQMSRNFFQALV